MKDQIIKKWADLAKIKTPHGFQSHILCIQPCPSIPATRETLMNLAKWLFADTWEKDTGQIIKAVDAAYEEIKNLRSTAQKEFENLRFKYSTFL